MSETSFVDLGFMTQDERPWYLFIQSLLNMSSSAASTGFGALLEDEDDDAGANVVKSDVSGVDRIDAKCSISSWVSSLCEGCRAGASVANHRLPIEGIDVFLSCLLSAHGLLFA